MISAPITHTRWWCRFNKASKQERLQMLVLRTKRKRMGDRRLYSIRRSKRHPADGKCAVCGGVGHCKHHITPIDCGGPNRADNMINICNNCHAEVHTWMVPTAPDYIKEMDNSFRNTISSL